MYDFIKIAERCLNPDKYYNNSKLEFIINVDEDTGEIKKYEADNDNIVFKIFPSNLVIITGSLHKYYNQGKHNYNNYTISNFKKTLEDLDHRFEIKPEKCYIKNLEVGVNLNLSFNPNFIIKRLVFHKGERFLAGRIAEGSYCQAKHAEYIIKAYDKGKQNFLNQKIFRFEIKYLKSGFLRKNNIETLKDLTFEENIKFLQKELIRRWEEVFLIEPFCTEKEIPFSKKEKFSEYINPNYWDDLYKKNKKQFYRNRKKYYEIIKNDNKESTKELIKQLITQKLQGLNK